MIQGIHAVDKSKKYLGMSQEELKEHPTAVGDVAMMSEMLSTVFVIGGPTGRFGANL